MTTKTPETASVGDIETLVRRAVELGADEAKVIDPKTVVTAAWVRMKCQYGCRRYGTNRCCPPRTPTPEETRAVLDCYSRAILIHCRGEEKSPTNIARSLEREAFLSGFYKAFGMGMGSCKFCDPCTPEACAHPQEARPSMEACGMDVYATARGNGFPIEVCRTHESEQNRYGLVLVD